MASYTSPSQMAHDKINLIRFVKKLEQSIDAPAPVLQDEHRAWVSNQAILQKVKHAKKLYNSVETYEQDHSTQQSRSSYLNDIKRTLDRLQEKAQEAAERTPRPSSRPKPILPTIPPPEPLILVIPPGEGPSNSGPSALESALLPTPNPLTNELLLTPADIVSPTNIVSDPPPYSLISNASSSKPTASSTLENKTKSPPAFLQNSAAVQQELQDQLAQMATQLKLNAMHFSNALSADKTLVESAGEKIEANYDVLQKEGSRLRARTWKSRGQTCFVMASLLAVVIAFAFMVLLIRFS